jgi:hypothetical protein
VSLRGLRGPVPALALACGVLLATSSPAPAAIQIGETFPADSSGGTCVDGRTLFQTGSPGGHYAAPSDGVITAWSHEASSTTVMFPNPVSSLKLKVARPMEGSDYMIVGDSPLETAVPGVLNTYANVRIPVAAGDVLAAYFADDGYCIRAPAPGYTTFEEPGDPSPGTTVTLTGPSDYQLDLSATLEADADGDAFGDETQDGCVGQAGATNGCPPETTITQGPKDKTKKRKATFAFNSNVPNASFRCAVDGQALKAPCTSPFTVKVKKGKHTFRVQATDSAGHAGAPATDSWKVKKKKKKN